MRKPLPLKFEELPFHPFHRGQGVNYNEGFWRDTFKDALLALGRVFKWLKKNWRKEFFVSFVFLLALLPEPHQVKAAVVPVSPAYIQPVPRLEPVVAVPFPIPDEVSPVPEPPAPIAPTAVVAPAPSIGYPMGANTYRDFIFKAESGFNPAAVNPGGCIGYGQDCNGWLITGRLNSVACPNWATDIDCQLKYWDWYANTIYGGWEQSYAFRSTHNYW